MHAYACGEKELVNDQLVSLEAKCFSICFYFFNRSGLSTLLNHMSSQGVSSKYIYHDIDQNNIVYHVLRKDNFNLLKKQGQLS